MPNKMERFTQRARRVLSLAQEEAERLQHHQIGTEHLLLGLMREEGGVAGRVLRDLGLDLRRVEELVTRLSTADDRSPHPQLDLSPGTKKVLELARGRSAAHGATTTSVPSTCSWELGAAAGRHRPGCAAPARRQPGGGPPPDEQGPAREPRVQSAQKAHDSAAEQTLAQGQYAAG